jgi:4-amino-4-deoxy-L-arabinose transferase-like glycosyltransferase
MTTAEFVHSARNRFERLFDALMDPARSERTMVFALIGYLAAWFLYAVIAKSSQDIHVDMGEMVAWSRQVGLGAPKHPPLAAWLVRAWFDVFPREDWAYYLFAMILPTVALWITWRMSARYLPRDKRVVGIALLTLVPFYNFHALKYNANTVLTPLWAATTWWFLHSFETRRVGWAALAGIGAAAAMLGKYWSVLLLAALGLAALTDRRRAAYFGSPAPYVTLAVGTILLTPHIDWLMDHDFVPFTYAIETHPAVLSMAAISALAFIATSLCYVAAPVAFSMLAAQPSLAAIRDTLWPSEMARRTVVIVFAAPFLFAVMITVALRVEISSLWAFSMMTLLPIVLLSSPLVIISRPAAVRLLALAVTFPLVMIVVSPFIALYIHREGAPNYQGDYRLIAQSVERIWREHTDRPLRIIGSTGLANGIVFYFANQPSTFDVDLPSETPWVDDDRIRSEGIAIVCDERDPLCMRELQGFAAHFHAVDDEHFTVARRYLGTDEAPGRFEIAIIPPQT